MNVLQVIHWTFSATTSTVLLFAAQSLVSGATIDQSSEDLNRAMSALRSGDERAVSTVASFGPLAFDVLASELQNPIGPCSQYLALRAFIQLPDKRVFEFLADSRCGGTASGESVGVILMYFQNTIGEPCDSFDYFDPDKLRTWYARHKDVLIWDPSNRHYKVSVPSRRIEPECQVQQRCGGRLLKPRSHKQRQHRCWPRCR